MDGSVDGSAREAGCVCVCVGGGVARGSRLQHPRKLSSCPSPSQKEASDRKAPNVLCALAYPQAGSLRAPRCQHTSRDPHPGPVLAEASRGVLIKGHNKTDPRAHQEKCAPGK